MVSAFIATPLLLKYRIKNKKEVRIAVPRYIYCGYKKFYVIIFAWSIESRNLSTLPIGLPTPNGEDNQQ